MNQNSPTYVSLIIKRLSKRYGHNIRTQLRNRNITELFVATLLSPQCTDKQVNKVTENLFKKFRSFKDYANSEPRVLSRYLSGLNYYNTKAKHLRSASKMIIHNFNGEVPKTLDELMTLPGVGRKVANVVLTEGYGIIAGIAVDTHCAVVSRRLGLSRSKDPYKIEKDLLKKTPEKDRGRISNLLIELGRDTCKAREKECYRCVLKDICSSSNSQNRGN